VFHAFSFLGTATLINARRLRANQLTKPNRSGEKYVEFSLMQSRTGRSVTMPIMKWPNPGSGLVACGNRRCVIWYIDTKVSENPASSTFRAEELYTLKMKVTSSCGQVVPTKL